MPDLKIETIEMKDGLVNFKVGYENRMVNLHSIQPIQEARKAIAHFSKDVKWVVVAGFGLGYVVETLIRETDFEVVVYEHNREIFDVACKARDLKNIVNHPRVHYFFQTQEMIAFLESHTVKELSFYIHRPYLTLFPELYKSVESILITYLSQTNINKATLKRFQKVWLRNIIKNSYFYFRLPGVRDMVCDMRGKPAVIIGAGPSLKKNLAELAEQRDRCITISTDTAYPMCIAHGFTPDFTVTCDPQDKNALFLLYSGSSDTTLIADSAASFLSFAKYRAKQTLLADTVFPLYRELQRFWPEKGYLMAGGSVSTTAFDFARALGCEPIILIGQDLAFSDKQTHYQGNVLEDMYYHKVNRIYSYEAYNAKTLVMADRIQVDGWNGQSVQTDRKFVTFLKWFEREIARTPQKVINATEGGVRIAAAEQMTFRDAAEKYLTANIDKSYHMKYNTADDRLLLDALEQVRHFCDKQLLAANRAKQASMKALEAYRRGSMNLDRYFTEMNGFDRGLMNALKQNDFLARFIELTMQDSIEMIIENSDQNTLTEELIEKWVALYREAVSGLRLISHLIQKRGKIWF